VKAKISIVALMLFLPACAQQYAPRPIPSSSGPTTNSFKTDAIECERQAALAGVGGKSAAFDSCMRARGHTPSR